MRILLTASWLGCALPLLACNDSVQGGLTQPRTVDFKQDGTGKKDRVQGSGTLLGLGLSFHVAAHSGPLGEDPKGHLSLEGLIFERGKVICLAVLGNRAAITTEREDAPGSARFLVVEDNGDPRDGIPDRASAGSSPITQPCAVLLTGTFTTFPVDGNVTVEDALPIDEPAIMP